MATVSAPHSRNIPPILSAKQEAILRAVNQVPFMRAQDVAQLLSKAKSLTSIRQLLADLSGGEDWKTGHHLYKFPLPTVRGNRPRLFVLGSAGVAYLRKIGVQVPWRCRPYKVRNYSFSYLMHQLAVAKLLVALHCFCREHPAYQVTETLNSYDILSDPPRATVIADGQERKVAVIPDAWVYVERVADGQETPLWFEIDNCSEYRKKFQKLLRGRLALLKNGYAEYFGTPCVLLCYLVTGSGSTPEHRDTRLHTLRRWTLDLLTQEKLEDWASVFRFAVVEEDIYATPLFDAPWYLADDADKPVRLFDPLTSTEQPASSADKETTDGDASQKFYPRV
jgi:hypothetical protein